MIDVLDGDCETGVWSGSVSRFARGFEEVALPRATPIERSSRGDPPLGGPGLSAALVPPLSHSSRQQSTHAAGGSALAIHVIAAGRTLRSLAVRTLASWRRWRLVRATRRALFGLDDRMLRDIGLSRPEVSSIALELSGDTEPRRIRTLLSPATSFHG